jgi:YD repeat-containing protein
VTNETIGAHSAGYTMDKVGNRTARTSDVLGVPSRSQAQFDTRDRLVSDRDENGAPRLFSWDVNGNTMLGETSLAGTAPVQQSEEYDFENRLIRRTTAKRVITILYDGDGNRVQRTVLENGATTVTRFLVDDRNPTGYAQVLEELSNRNSIRMPHTRTATTSTPVTIPQHFTFTATTATAASAS